MQSLDQEIRTLRSIFWSERDPEGRAFVPLADAYRRAGDFRQAVELLTDGLERHPDFTSGHVVAARLFLEKGLIQEAELASRKVLTLDPDNLFGLELLAGALEAHGQTDEPAALRGRLVELTASAPVAVAVAAAAEVETAEPAAEEEVLDIAALAPEPEPEPEEEVFDIAALAPEPEPEEEVFDIAALAPEPEPEPEEEEAVDLADLSLEAGGELERVIDLDTLVPDEDVIDPAELAPEASSTGDEDLPSDEPLDDEPVVTRTMAELYARQGLTERALEVFRQLLEVTPGDGGLRRRIAELESAEAAVDAGEAPKGLIPAIVEPPVDEDVVSGHAWDSEAHQAPHEVDTPFAWTLDDPEDARSAEPAIGSYFERLLAWEPGAGDREETDAGAAGAEGDDFTDWLNQDEA